MIKIIIGLIAVMLANILLGATLANFKQEFKKKTFLNGVFKAGCVILGCLLMYASAYLNQDILVATINGSDINLLEGMRALFIAGIVLYAGKDLVKLANLLKIKSDIQSKESKESE